MAVANILTFGGISTATYGLVVEGSGDYSAPKRAVETIEIPGRNGAFQLDKGYYENIEVEYNIVVKDATQADFRDAIDAYRNAIVSQIGYQRLEDTYHPNEYRMAMYAGGLDEDPAFHGNGAIFKVKFDCKPQRFLTSGETAIEVDSGDTINNPTPFEASPLLEVRGHGDLTVNGHTITMSDNEVGYVVLSNGDNFDMATCAAMNLHYNVSLIGDNDDITITGLSLTLGVISSRTADVTGVTFNGLDSRFSGGASFLPGGSGEIYISADTLTVKRNTAATDQFTATITYEDSTSDTVNLAVVAGFVDGKGTFMGLIAGNDSNYEYTYDRICHIEKMDCVSTASVLGNPMYIDCDLGEVYKYVDGTPVSVNRYIDLGSRLPVLSPGASEITFDSTITEVNVTPRWWLV